MTFDWSVNGGLLDSGLGPPYPVQMCNLYSLTRGQQAIRELTGAMRDGTGNLPILLSIFPDYAALFMHNAPDGVRELCLAR